MESQPQNPEFRINPDNFHPCCNVTHSSSCTRTHNLVYIQLHTNYTGARSAVGKVSGCRYFSDCRSRGREFDPSPVPYFHGD